MLLCSESYENAKLTTQSSLRPDRTARSYYSKDQTGLQSGGAKLYILVFFTVSIFDLTVWSSLVEAGLRSRSAEL